MANNPTARKRVRQAIKRTLQNNVVKSRMRYSIKKFAESLKNSNADDVKISLVNAIRVIDKAAAKGVIHKNAAARKKSSLYKRMAEANISVS